MPGARVQPEIGPGQCSSPHAVPPSCSFPHACRLPTPANDIQSLRYYCQVATDMTSLILAGMSVAIT